MSVMMRGRSGPGNISGWPSPARDLALFANVGCPGGYGRGWFGVCCGLAVPCVSCGRLRVRSVLCGRGAWRNTAASGAAKEHGNLGVPWHLRNVVTSLMKNLEYGKGTDMPMTTRRPPKTKHTFPLNWRAASIIAPQTPLSLLEGN